LTLLPYLHFTELAVGPVDPGLVLTTTPGRLSFYWRSVFAAGSYDHEVERLLPNHPADLHDLVRRAAGLSYTARCLRELVFEAVRNAEFPALPSRSDCLFLYCHAAAAHHQQLDVTGRALLEVEPADGARVFRADASWLDQTFLVPELESMARRYWSGATAVDAKPEVLLTGEFRVVRVVEPARPGITVEGRDFVDLHRP